MCIVQLACYFTGCALWIVPRGTGSGSCLCCDEHAPSQPHSFRCLRWDTPKCQVPGPGLEIWLVPIEQILFCLGFSGSCWVWILIPSALCFCKLRDIWECKHWRLCVWILGSQWCCCSFIWGVSLQVFVHIKRSGWHPLEVNMILCQHSDLEMLRYFSKPNFLAYVF